MIAIKKSGIVDSVTIEKGRRTIYYTIIRKKSVSTGWWGCWNWPRSSCNYTNNSIGYSKSTLGSRPYSYSGRDSRSKSSISNIPRW